MAGAADMFARSLPVFGFVASFIVVFISIGSRASGLKDSLARSAYQCQVQSEKPPVDDEEGGGILGLEHDTEG